MSGRIDVAEVVELLEEATLSLPDSISPDTDLLGLKGLDSMGMVSFMGLVRDHAGVDLNASDFAACRTPIDVHAVIAKALAG